MKFLWWPETFQYDKYTKTEEIKKVANALTLYKQSVNILSFVYKKSFFIVIVWFVWHIASIKYSDDRNVWADRRSFQKHLFHTVQSHPDWFPALTLISAEQCPIPGSLKSLSGRLELGTKAGIRSSRSPTAFRNWTSNRDSGYGKDTRKNSCYWEWKQTVVLLP